MNVRAARTSVCRLAVIAVTVFGMSIPAARSVGARPGTAGGASDAEATPLRWLDRLPDDPDYPGSQASYLDAISAPAAWDVTTGSDDLIVAVLDSGVDAGHPDLAGRLVAGTDIVNHDDDPADDVGHGTKMAGVIAAVANNHLGIAGVSWLGKIMPVKVAGTSGAAADPDIAAGIVWAVDHGAKVISLSVSAAGESTVLRRGLNYALGRDVVVVASAGNGATDEPWYPAAYRGVVAVGASDASGHRASFSNYGRWVDVNAPGVRLTTTSAANHGNGVGSGPSYSTALVAGVALLVRAAHPEAGQAEVADRLRRSAIGRGPVGADGIANPGVIDAAAALRLGGRPAAQTSSPTGYWMLGNGGAVFPFGRAAYHGDALGDLTTGPAVDLAATPVGAGYWLMDEAGQVYPAGDARDFGEIAAGNLRPGEKAAALLPTLSGRGYLIFTRAGRVFAFGDATSFGDLSAVALNGPVVDAARTASGHGYDLVAADGGIFSFGDARFAGSMGGRRLNAPIHSLVADPDGEGYWMSGTDGGIFAFGAPFRGSLGSTRLNAPITAMVAHGDGYLMVSSDGGGFNFSARPFAGSLGDHPPASPIVAVSAIPGP